MTLFCSILTGFIDLIDAWPLN